MATATDLSCPLCDHAPSAAYFQDAPSGQDYYHCRVCDLVYLAPAHQISGFEEKKRYEQHRNDPADAGYRQFLSKVLDPMLKRLPPGAEGLDFGSGPGPTLSVMFEEQGFRMHLYDPFFSPDPAVLGRTYDFIVCTETAEHFREPGKSFRRLHELLREGGWLAVMTESRDGLSDFGAWYYRKDPTHVAFYSSGTHRWLANRFGWQMEKVHRNVVLFRKI